MTEVAVRQSFIVLVMFLYIVSTLPHVGAMLGRRKICV